MRARLTSITAWVFSIAFVVLAAREHLARGGPSRPRTVMSHSGLAPERGEAALLLLRHASRTIPPYARVAVVKPRSRHEDDLMLAAGHGQLPHHRAVHASTLEGGADPPDFVITLDAPLEDPRYERIYESPAGAIWERIR